MLKQILQRYMPRGLGKTFLPKLNHPYAPPSERSNGQPHRGWGRSRFCTLVDDIMWWFSRPKFCILSLKIPRWKTQMERKSSKNCSDSFLWTNESFSLWNHVSRNLTLFSSRRIRALGLFWTNRRSDVSEETWGTFCTLWSRKVRLLKGIFVLIKVSWTFSTFWHWRERKTRKCAFEIDFFAMRSADLTWVNGSRIQLVLYANYFLGLTYGFFNKNFQEIKLFIYVIFHS